MVRARALPVFVMRPRLTVLPLECSLGTSPNQAMSLAWIVEAVDVADLCGQCRSDDRVDAVQ